MIIRLFEIIQLPAKKTIFKVENDARKKFWEDLERADEKIMCFGQLLASACVVIRA